MGLFRAFKSESILPQPTENKKGNVSIDLHIVAFGGFKTRHFIAEIRALSPTLLMKSGTQWSCPFY